MFRFYEAYKDSLIVAPVVPQLQQFDEPNLMDIRSTVLAQARVVNSSASFNTRKAKRQERPFHLYKDYAYLYVSIVKVWIGKRSFTGLAPFWWGV